MNTDLLILKKAAERWKEKLIKIKVAMFDVDGILTDGKLFYMGQEVGWNRSFHARDGYGLLLLKNAGIKVGIISGGNSIAVQERFYHNLPLDKEFIFLGDEDKRDAYQKILDKGYRDEEILYMGDELFDIPLLKRAGFSATVPAASFEVQEASNFVTLSKSGEGCVREVIDMLRIVQHITAPIADF